MFVFVAYDPKPYKSWILQHVPQNILTSYRAQNLWEPLGELKAGRGEEKFKTSENCFQMHGHRSSPISHFLSHCLSLSHSAFFFSFSHSSCYAFLSVCCLDVVVVSVSRTKFGVHLFCAHSCYLYISTVCAPYVAHHPPHATLKLWQPVCLSGWEGCEHRTCLS